MALFETFPLGVLFLDGQCVIQAANASASSILGVPPAELVGQHCAGDRWNTLDEDGSPLSSDRLPAARALAGGEAVRNVVLSIQPPGAQDRRWLRVTAMPLAGTADTDVLRLYLVIEDVTEHRKTVEELRRTRDLLEQEAQDRSQALSGTTDELTAQISRRKQTEAALHRSEEMFRRFVDRSADLIFLYRLRPERRFEFVSAAATAMTGYAPDEHYANPDLGLQIVHADDRHLLQELAAGTRDVTQPLTMRWIRKDGCVIWIELQSIPVRDETGELIALQGIARDVTERVRTETKLRDSERFLQTVIDTEPECVKLLARDGGLLMMNRAGLNMIDADSFEQVRGKPAAGMVLPAYRQEFIRITEEAFQGKSGKLTFEAVGLKGRHIWLETNVAPLRDERDEVMAALGITRDVTDRIRSEEMLRNVAERISTKTGDAYFRAVTQFICQELGTDVAFIAERLPDGSTVRTNALYRDGTYAEDFVYAIEGTPCANVIGKSSCFYPNSVQTLFPHDSLLVTMQMVSYAGIPLVDSSGRPQGGLVTLGRGPLRDADRDRVINLLHIFAGRVSAELERTQIEEELRQSEQRYRQLVESITSYLYTVTVENGRAVRTTHGEACRTVTGYSAREYAAEPFLWYKMVHEDDKAAVLAQAAVVLAGGRPLPLEHRILHKNGSIIWVRNSVAPRFSPDGQLVAYDGIIEDITERKRTDMLVKNILEAVDEGFIIIDQGLNVVTANRAFLVQCGLTLDEVVGKKCYAVTHHLDRPCFEKGEDCAVRAALDAGESREVVHTHHDPGGRPIFVETKAFPLRSDTGQIVAAIEIVSNISERKRLEDQLRHSQKMEAVGLLAGGVAHDFNNILTAIVGYGNLLKMKTPTDDPRMAYAEQILASAARAADLTQSLLAFSRKQVINPQPMDVNGAIRRFESLLQRVIGEDIELQTDLVPRELTILADPSQIEQVLMNLVTNARDAMPRGGRLYIRTEAATIDDTFRHSHGYGVPGAYASISVVDSGVGVEESQLAHIFEPFYTTKEPGKGTGLGLAIVYGIMKQNKGYVLIESEPGEGTIVRLYFPLIAASPEQPTRPAEDSFEEGHETILIAEDDDALRRLTATMLTEFGYTVIEARDGEEAVRKFRDHAGTVDLAIIDVVMPHKGGKEVRDEILQIDPTARVLYISGYNAEVLRAKGIGDSASECILKPVSPMDLLHAVRRMLDRDGKSGAAGDARR